MTESELKHIADQSIEEALCALPTGPPLEVWTNFIDRLDVYGRRIIMEQNKAASQSAKRP